MGGFIKSLSRDTLCRDPRLTNSNFVQLYPTNIQQGAGWRILSFKLLRESHTMTIGKIL